MLTVVWWVFICLKLLVLSSLNPYSFPPQTTEIIELKNQSVSIFKYFKSILFSRQNIYFLPIHSFSSVQWLSHVWHFATPWIATRQASLSITNSRSSLKPMSIESLMPSSHLILCRPLLLLPLIPPSIRVFSNSQLFTWGGQSTGASALASFLPKKSQGWSPSEWTGWISLQCKGLSRVFSNTTVQKHQFFGAQLSS